MLISIKLNTFYPVGKNSVSKDHSSKVQDLRFSSDILNFVSVFLRSCRFKNFVFNGKTYVCILDFIIFELT